MAKLLIVLGSALLLVGLVLAYLPKIPFLGRLPGDFVVKRGNFTLYVPLMTSFLLSVLLTLLFSFLRKK